MMNHLGVDSVELWHMAARVGEGGDVGRHGEQQVAHSHQDAQDIAPILVHPEQKRL